MARRKAVKNAKKSVNHKNNGNEAGIPLVDKKGKTFQDHEVERQCAAIRALRDMETEQLLTMIRLLRSYFSEEQLQVPVLKFFGETFPNLSITATEKDRLYEVKWKDSIDNLSFELADERAMHTSLLHQMSINYPHCSAGIPSLDSYTFSKKSVKTGPFGVDKLQIRSFALDEPSHSQVLEQKDCLQTPDVNNNRLSFGMTPKTLRLPKHGEMLLSAHGSPLGVYKEDNMETIQETESG